MPPPARTKAKKKPAGKKPAKKKPAKKAAAGKAKAPALARRTTFLYVPDAEARAADIRPRDGATEAERVSAWRCAGRNPGRVASLRERLAPPLRVAWQAALGAPAGSAPIVSFDGVVYVADREGALHVLDAAEGRAGRSLRTDPIGEGSPVWPLVEQGLVPPDRVPVSSAPAVSGWQLLFGDDEGIFYCVRRGEGTVIWRKSAPLSLAARRAQAYQAPLVADGRVYTVDADGNLYAADARSGRTALSLYLRGRPAAPPALARDRVLVATHPIYGGEPPQLHAIVVSSGARAWHRELPGLPRRALAALGETVVVGGDFGLAAFGTDAGVPRWRTPAGDLPDAAVTGPLALDPRRVYAPAGERVVARWLGSGAPCWSRATGVKAPTSGLACAGGVLWVAAGRVLLALAAESGEVLDRIRLPGAAVGAPTVALDRLFVATAGGDVLALAP